MRNYVSEAHFLRVPNYDDSLTTTDCDISSFYTFKVSACVNTHSLELNFYLPKKVYTNAVTKLILEF